MESLGVTIPFNVFKFDQNSKLVLTDIDGTITESDTIGHVGYYVGFSAEHDDVVELFQKIGKFLIGTSEKNRKSIFINVFPIIATIL